MTVRHVIGYYDTEEEAVDAIQQLISQRYKSEDISVISKNADHIDYITEETDTKAVEGAATGVATGGALGRLGGILAGLGTLAIPGLGPVVAAVPIIAGLTGAAAGAGVGGIAGALIGMEISEEDAHKYNEYVKEGKILVLVDRERQV